MNQTTLSADSSSTVAREMAPRHAETPQVSAGLRRFAWFVLVYNLLDILWGGVVTATGSGAGCGDQWPLCQGAAIPQAPQFHTLIEFTHRLMSGGALLLIAGLLIWTWRVTRKGALARWAAVIALILVVNEAFLGALLVTVAAHKASVASGVILFSCHLTNTLLLVAALALTAEFLTRFRSGATTALNRGALLFSVLSILTTLAVGISGSLVALGDALYPSASLLQAIRQDFSPGGPLLLRLRWVHPAMALFAGGCIVWLVAQSFYRSRTSRTRSLGIVVLGTLVAQYLLGIADVLLQAPTWLRIGHLLGADVFWICLVLLTANYCLVESRSLPERASTTTD